MQERTFSAALALAAETIEAGLAYGDSKYQARKEPNIHMAQWPGGVGEEPLFNDMV